MARRRGQPEESGSVAVSHSGAKIRAKGALMAVTRSTPANRARSNARPPVGAVSGRGLERLLLIMTFLLIGGALTLTSMARLARVSEGLNAPLNLSTLDRREQLLPYLQAAGSPAERQYMAGQMFLHLRAGSGEISHVGEIGQIHVPIREVLSTRGLTTLQARAKQIQSKRPEADSMLLLTAADVARMKPLFVVRDGARFRNQLVLWSVIFFCAFAAVHLFWTLRGTRGTQYLLPSVLLLGGVGMTLMVTLRDPLRDTLAFANFAQGVAAGGLVLSLASTLDYRRHTGKLSYVFLLASFVMSGALIFFGSGPTGSDARVNLLGFQPAEIIRILLVFFLAGYFADRWELLRTLRENRAELRSVSRWVEVPRLEYLVPVLAGVVFSLAFFFLQKDLGPALLIACMFLAMYAVARDRYLFALAGLVLILAGFASGYYYIFPQQRRRP